MKRKKPLKSGKISYENVSQGQDSTFKFSKEQNKISLLEEKYFNYLFNILSSSRFTNRLINLRNNVNKTWNHSYGIYKKEKKIPNPVDKAVERLVNFELYNNKKYGKYITDVYPTNVSSDTAFVTEDAVINLDCKTTSFSGNEQDWRVQLVGKNQSSFDNGKNLYYKTHDVSISTSANLEKKFGKKYVLSFFISFLYEIDEHNNSPFSWSAALKDNVRLCCMPHGELSNSFQHNLINAAKDVVPTNDPNPSGTNSVKVLHEYLEKRYHHCHKKNKNVLWKGLKAWKI